MAYDKVNQHTLMFAGKGTIADPLLQDFWTWQGNAWTEIVAANPPPRRSLHVMDYHEQAGVSVVFGGRDDDDNPRGDTWTWNGEIEEWDQLTLPLAPMARKDSAMVYDSERGCMLLFGGYDTDYLSDTWELCYVSP